MPAQPANPGPGRDDGGGFWLYLYPEALDLGGGLIIVGGISAGFSARETVAPPPRGIWGNNPTYPLRSASSSPFRRVTTAARAPTGLAELTSSWSPVNSGPISLS